MSATALADIIPLAVARRAAPAPPAGDAEAALAAALRRASPASAHGFALAMHERLCERGEDAHAEMWLGIVRRLRAGG